MTIIVVGLGPAGPELLTAETRSLLSGDTPVFLRTRQHPAAGEFLNAQTFDAIYEKADSFDAVYDAIVERLCAEAADGDVIYAVPGSPFVAERSVAALVASAPRRGIAIDVRPALSFLDLTWVRLGIDPFAQNVTIADAMTITDDLAGGRGPFLIGQCHSRTVLSDVKLAVSDLVEDPGSFVLLHHLGLADEIVREVPWHELDHFAEADHLTSVFVPRLFSTVGASFASLTEVMRTLRNQCPWDAEQTVDSLAPYVVEEARELVEAIQALSDEAAEGDRVGSSEAADEERIEHYQDELGDVLFQVVFHACIAAEEGWFTLTDVSERLQEKLILRHPHVYPRDDFDASGIVTASDVLAAWKPIKAAAKEILEKRRSENRVGERP